MINGVALLPQFRESLRNIHGHPLSDYTATSEYYLESPPKNNMVIITDAPCYSRLAAVTCRLTLRLPKSEWRSCSKTRAHLCY